MTFKHTITFSGTAEDLRVALIEELDRRHEGFNRPGARNAGAREALEKFRQFLDELVIESTPNPRSTQ
jgi:hypothetical protein